MTTPPRTHTLAVGNLTAVFWPEVGMICTSLKHRGEEILRLVEDLDEAAAAGRAVGIPLLHPWANRLDGPHYHAAGKQVELDPDSPMLMRDWNKVILHGVPWSKLDWQVIAAGATTLAARLCWNRPEWLAVFPFEHELRITASLEPAGLSLRTTLVAGAGDAVPVSFGYHPYLAIPGLRREDWDLSLPPMLSIELDALLLPTGERNALPQLDAKLADMDFDHGFAFQTTNPTMSIAGARRRVSVDFLRGYPYAQIYAPPGHDYISLEPMTAPTNALVSGEALPIVQPGEQFEATFRVRVEDIADPA